jgi:HPt (histidine-containing phosphotransfer) domain-containing protein
MGDELSEILDIYMTQMSDNLKKLTAAIASGNADEVDLIAHNCLGTSANCGIVSVTQPLRELERMGREGRLDGAEALDHQLSIEFERAKVFLKEHLPQLAI